MDNNDMIITEKQYRSNTTDGIGSCFRIKGKTAKMLMINEIKTGKFFLIKIAITSLF